MSRESGKPVSIEFIHRQSAHCESGVTSNLLNHYGHPISEAMAFGIGSGLFFGYFPFIKINHLPLVTFRGAPGSIFKKCASRLGVQVESRQFRDPHRAMNALDASIYAGVPTGLQTGVYWLPYFPAALRFHFNAHNLVVFGREGDEYLISDPVIDQAVRCARADLQRARFAKGALAPKGRMYFLDEVPDQIPSLRQCGAGSKRWRFAWSRCRSRLSVCVGWRCWRGIFNVGHRSLEMSAPLFIWGT